MPDNNDKPQKVNIGFEGGGGLSARIAPPDLEQLQRALASEDRGWYDLRSEDGTIGLHLGKVVYVLVDTEGHRVGFGA